MDTMDRSSYHRINDIGKTTIIVSFFLLVIWVFNILWNRRKLYIYSWNIPGPLAFPVIGNYYQLFGDREDIVNKLMTISKSYPAVSKFWFGPKLMIFVSHPEYVEILLNNVNCLEKDDLYRFLVKTVGTGLVTAPVKKWRKHRKIIAPSFNGKVLESFVEIFARQATILKSKLEKCVGQTNMDLFTIFSLCTMDSICETAMGVTVNAQSDPEWALIKNLDRGLEITQLRLFCPWYHSDLIFNFTPLRKKLDEAIRICRSYTTMVIRTKAEAHKKTLEERESGFTVDTEESKRIKASLDLMLENSDFTEEELREEVEILIVAGLDSNAAALTFLFMSLGMFQDIQEKVYKEVIEIVGPDRNVEPSDLPQMKYLEMVIKEVLRIFPIVPLFLRQLGKDIDLGDITLPEGASLFFPTWKIHTDPELWPEPLKFVPERFLPENVAKRHPCSYIPFSYGPRNCIGYRYAMMNMKTITATILRKYKIFCDYKRVEDIKLKVHIVARPADGAKVRLEFR